MNDEEKILSLLKSTDYTNRMLGFELARVEKVRIYYLIYDDWLKNDLEHGSSKFYFFGDICIEPLNYSKRNFELTYFSKILVGDCIQTPRTFNIQRKEYFKNINQTLIKLIELLKIE